MEIPTPYFLTLNKWIFNLFLRFIHWNKLISSSIFPIPYNQFHPLMCLFSHSGRQTRQMPPFSWQKYTSNLFSIFQWENCGLKTKKIQHKKLVIRKKPGNISLQKSEEIFSLFLMPNWRSYFFLSAGRERKIYLFIEWDPGTLERYHNSQ